LVEKVAQHKHCRHCERAIPPKDEFCGEECETEWKTSMKKKKSQLTYFYAIMVILMILAMFMLMMG